MKTTLLYVLGGFGIFIVSGAITFFTLEALNPDVTAPEPSISSPVESPKDTEATQPVQQEESDFERARQDVEVKNSVAKVSTAIMMYASNNRGSMPSSDEDVTLLMQQYIEGRDIVNPVTNEPFTIVFDPSELTSSVIAYQLGYQCSPSPTGLATEVGQSRDYALTARLPSGGYYCLGSN